MATLKQMPPTTLSPMPPPVSMTTSGGVLLDRKGNYASSLSPPLTSHSPLHHTNINGGLPAPYYEHNIIKYSNWICVTFAHKFIVSLVKAIDFGNNCI